MVDKQCCDQYQKLKQLAAGRSHQQKRSVTSFLASSVPWQIRDSLQDFHRVLPAKSVRPSHKDEKQLRWAVKPLPCSVIFQQNDFRTLSALKQPLTTIMTHLLSLL